MKLITSILTAAALSSATGLAQNAGALPAEQRINGKLVWAAFGPQQAVVQASSAVIYKDAKSRDLAIYGTVVSEDGFILTKASEIEGAEHLSLRIGGDLYKEVKLIATDPRWDVAVLKVQPEAPLKPIVLSDESDIEQGKWVVSNGSTMRRERRIKVGIVSAVTREITGKQSRVILGVGLGDESDKGVKIRQVSDKGGAEKAGLKKGDILQSADGKPIKKRTELLKILKDKNPGDKLSVEVLRKKEVKKFEVELMARPAGPERFTRNDQMSGAKYSLSKRRSDFPRVIHHDTPLINETMGGPLIDLNGTCVGMNIARASRVATFAIPARELREIITRLAK